MTGGETYLGRHLSNSDYYDQARTIQGQWIGEGAKRLGLDEGQAVMPQAFEQLRENLHPLTGAKLTPRTNTMRQEKGRQVSNRRCCYDATCSAPKSVSVMALVGRDQRLVDAHRKASSAAFREMERFAQTQISVGKGKEREYTGNLIGAAFHHDTSRALDPQLHTHFVVMTPTWDEKRRRWISLEAREIYNRSKYLSEVYRNELAKEVMRCGYEIETKRNGFEIKGVPEDILQRFSQRSAVRDKVVAEQEKLLGRALSNDEKAVLVRESRTPKLRTISTEQVKGQQHGRLSRPEHRHLETIREKASSRRATPVVNAKSALAYAVEHCFERRTVVQDYELLAESLRADYGQQDVDQLREALEQNKELLRAHGKVTTRESLERETQLVEFIDQNRGKYSRLGAAVKEAAFLSDEQGAAVERVLGSRDRVTVLRGAAGTGKTTVLSRIIEGMGDETVVFAPTSKSVEVLQTDGTQCAKDGLSRAARSLLQTQTIQALLQSPRLQQSCRNRLVVVDEYSFLSLKDLHRLCQIAQRENARLLLSGDSRQHLSVNAGDAARIVEQESRVRIAELLTIRRQLKPGYREAVRSLAMGQFKKGLGLLLGDNSIIEIADREQRHQQMVGDYLKASRETKTVRTLKGLQHVPKQCLVIVPTWEELDQVTAILRDRLKEEGQLPKVGRNFKILRDGHWTLAEKKNLRKFCGGEVLVFHKEAEGFAKHDEVRVLRVKGQHLEVRHRDGRTGLLSAKQGEAYSVYSEKELEFCAGDKIRLGANALDEQGKKLSNGSVLTVRSVDNEGWVTTQEGRRFQSRVFNHGYALTSHAAQGVTCDQVFVAEVLSKQGLYVSASRGREKVTFYTPNRDRFLETAGIRSEQRQSATEFAREANVQCAGPERLRLISEALRNGLAGTQQFLGLFLGYAAAATQRLARLGRSLQQDQKQDRSPK
jgi:conjugative relaxase-like TrwC/TraI family protein